MELVKEEKIEELMGQLKTYSKIQVELLKLRTIEKAAVSGSYLLSNFLLFSVFAITLIFLSIAAAFYFTQLLGNIILGFALVGVFYLVVTVLVLLLRKKFIEHPIKNKIIYTLSDPGK